MQKGIICSCCGASYKKQPEKITGKVLRAMRDAKGISLRQFARITHNQIKWSTLSTYEREARGLDYCKGQFISTLLGKVKTCRSKTCNNFFIACRKGTIYCSEACKNAEKQRQYRLRKKEV